MVEIPACGYTAGLDALAMDPLAERWLVGHLDAGALARVRELDEVISEHALRVARYVDQWAPPRLQAHDLDGQRVDEVVLAEEHRSLLKALRPMVGLALHPRHGVLAALAAGYLLADPGLYCSLTLTTQVALVLSELEPHHQALGRLVHGPWFGATWFTETHAGSDLGALKARAHQRPDGTWTIERAEKYFASNAGLADVALVAAHVGEPRGVRSLGLFLVRRRRDDGSVTFSVRRLKDKLGTRAVPTGEVDLDHTPAQLLAGPPDGVHRILESLTFARVANAMSAAGIARIVVGEATLRGQHRLAFGRQLTAHPAFADDLARMRARQIATTMLAFELAELTQEAVGSHHGQRPYQLLRALSHVAKVTTASSAVRLSEQAMISFGGLGYVEDAPIARWHREALVLPIWEGTPHVHALDAAEVLSQRDVRDELVERLVASAPGSVGAALTEAAWRLASRIAEAPPNARLLLERLGAVLASAVVARLDLPGIDPEPLAAWLAAAALEGEPDETPPLGGLPPLELDRQRQSGEDDLSR